jgi:hypothetical protein
VVERTLKEGHPRCVTLVAAVLELMSAIVIPSLAQAFAVCEHASSI